MGNVLILYDSKTGHTRSMAEHVAEGAREIAGVDIRIRSVEDAAAEDVLWADGIAAGSPTYLGVESWKMKRFWDNLIPAVWGKMDGKLGCAFSSSGGWGGGAELTCLSLLIMLMNVGMLTFGVPDYVGKQSTLHYGAVTSGKPDTDFAVAACRRLGKRLAQWVACYIDGRSEYAPGALSART